MMDVLKGEIVDSLRLAKDLPFMPLYRVVFSQLLGLWSPHERIYWQYDQEDIVNLDTGSEFFLNMTVNFG